MRSFNDKEKAILTKLVNGEKLQYFHEFLFESYIEGSNGLVIDYESRKIYIATPPENRTDSLVDREKECNYMDEIICLLLLLKLLFEERYLIASQRNDGLEQSSKTLLTCGDFKHLYDISANGNFPDRDDLFLLKREGIRLAGSSSSLEWLKIFNNEGDLLYDTHEILLCPFDIIEDYLQTEFYITDDLVNYVRKGYRSDEEIRQHKVMRATWISIALAFLIGLSSVVFQIISSKNTNIYLQQIESDIQVIVRYIDNI